MEKQERNLNNMSIGKNYDIKYEDNSNQVKTDFKAKKVKITYAIGLKWLEICTKIITNKNIVDTGRLRASLSFITPTQSGDNNPFETEDSISGRADDDTIIVGSNVKYASKQELTNKKGSFIEPSLTGYANEYKKVTEQILKE